jgi:hypothetical protein
MEPSAPPQGAAVPLLQVEVAGQVCLGMLDTGATISVMSRRKAEDLGLAIRGLRGQKAVGFDGRRQELLAYIPKCPLRFGDVRVFTCVFVVEEIDESYDLILGRPFQRETSCQTWFDSDGNTMVRLFDREESEYVDIMDVADRMAPLN